MSPSTVPLLHSVLVRINKGWAPECPVRFEDASLATKPEYLPPLSTPH